MDQFPHDDCPRDKDQPQGDFKPHPGSRMVHARPAAPYVQLLLSPILQERHTLSVNQAIALMRELALAINAVDQSVASNDLWEAVSAAVSEWGVKDND